MATIPRVITRHTAQEAAFLWLLRDGAVAPHYKLRDLANLDQRVEAHIDGLRIAGDAGWELVAEQLEEHPEPGEAFAAAVLAVESGNQGHIALVLKAAAVPALGRAVASARSGGSPRQPPRIRFFTCNSMPNPRSAASALPPGPSGVSIRANGSKRRSAMPIPGSGLGLKAVGELGDLNLLALARSYLKDENAAVRANAAWTWRYSAATFLASISCRIWPCYPAHFNCRPFMSRCGEWNSPPPAVGSPCWPRCRPRPGCPCRHRGARRCLIGAAIVGRLKTPALARLAGEAFEMITGADISYEDLDGKKPEGFEAGPTENADDDDSGP